jgi:hypothetical protein
MDRINLLSYQLLFGIPVGPVDKVPSSLNSLPAKRTGAHAG